MTQEATMIAVDDSDFMRNGDFHPSRLQAQNDAVSLICQSKRQKNPENTLGLISLANTEVLCTLTNDNSKIYNRLHMVEPKGTISFSTCVQIAHLALRHRQLRHQKMRIVCFIGSPVLEDEKTLSKLAKRLKKEKVSVDIINFGENEENQQKLSEFIDTLNGKDGTGSHLVNVPPGAVLHDSLVSSPILAGEFGGAVGSGGLGLGFGLDASEDPDLLYALRVSMEDQRMRQEQEVNSGGGTAGAATSLPAASGTSEDAMLQQALEMSMRAVGGGTTQPAAHLPMDIDLSAMTEEEQLNYALAMSLQDSGQVQNEAPKEQAAVVPMDVDQPAVAATSDTGSGAAASTEPAAANLDVIHDASFLQSVLRSLPGVDTQDEEVLNAIDALSKPGQKKEEDKKDKDADKSS